MTKRNPLPKSVRDAIATTATAILAAIAPQDQIDAAIRSFFAELEGRGVNSLTNAEPLDRVITRRQAAEILHCSTATITRHVKDGKLRAVYGGDGVRLTGIAESSIRAFMEGKVA